MMEHVNSNYSYWKGQCQPSDLSSEEEVEEATSNQQVNGYSSNNLLMLERNILVSYRKIHDV